MPFLVSTPFLTYAPVPNFIPHALPVLTAYDSDLHTVFGLRSTCGPNAFSCPPFCFVLSVPSHSAPLGPAGFLPAFSGVLAHPASGGPPDSAVLNNRSRSALKKVKAQELEGRG